MKTQEILNNLLSDMDDVMDNARCAVADLECAETCETIKDFDVCLSDAMASLKAAIDELQMLQARTRAEMKPKK